MAKFLFVENDRSILNSAGLLLRISFPHDVFVFATSCAEAVAAVTKAAEDQSPFDGCVTDFNYAGLADGDRPNPKGSGALDFIYFLKVNNIALPMVILSGTDSEKIKLALQRRGISSDAIPILQKSKDTIRQAFDRLKSQLAQAVRPGQTGALYTPGFGCGSES